jgi:hypothetical protein
MKTNDRLVVKKNTIADLFGKRVEMIEIETSIIPANKNNSIEKKYIVHFMDNGEINYVGEELYDQLWSLCIPEHDITII